MTAGKIAKVLVDRMAALLTLTVLAPVLLLVMGAVRIDSPGPVFFRQERIGRHGRAFMLWKFRTMIQGADRMALGYLVERNDARITRVGRFLRRWSLDELPQLFNVLKGDMSLVGPRPTLRYQVDQYSPQQRRRLEVLPGLTGWAQINGRNELSWPERIDLDIQYIDNWSFWLDCKIMFRTLPAVVSNREVYTDDLSKFDVRRK